MNLVGEVMLSVSVEADSQMMVTEVELMHAGHDEDAGYRILWAVSGVARVASDVVHTQLLPA